MPQTTSGPTSTGSRGLLLVCLAGVVWGTIGPAVDLVDARTPLSVLTTGAYRSLVAIVTLALVVALTARLGRCRALLRDAPARACGVGFLTATFQLLFFVAVVSTGVSIATVVCLGFAPVLLLVLSAVRTRSRPAWPDVVTVGAAVTGLVAVGLGGGGDPDPARPVVGVLAALGSGTAYALSAEIGAPLTKRHDAVSVAAVTMTICGVVLVLVGLPTALLRGETMTTNDPASWWLIAYLGVVTMAIAYAVFFAGLRTVPSGAVVVATLLEPVTAVVIAVLFLGEALTPVGLLGSLLILAAIASLGRRSPAPPPPQ